MLTVQCILALALCICCSSACSHVQRCSQTGDVYRWYRDPHLPIGRTDITRFPHAVLEVKLSLPEGQTAPEWVTDLIESGYLTEVRRVYQEICKCKNKSYDDFSSGG